MNAREGLPDFFPREAEMRRNQTAVSELLRKYENVPSSKPLCALLEAVSQFQDDAAGSFRKARQKLSQEELLKKLETMGVAFHSFLEYVVKQNAHLDQNSLVVLQRAWSYCRGTVVNQLSELERNNDALYAVYNQRENALKEIIISAPSLLDFSASPSVLNIDNRGF